MAGPSPENLFGTRLAADPGAPLVTCYDDATGERAELSAKSLANWIAKTYFLLTDSLGLGPGDTAAIRLPVHWLAVPVLFGCWYAGLQVVTDQPASVAFGDAGSLGSLPAAEEIYAVSMLPMAQPDIPPPGAEDYTTAVRPMPDAWAGVRALAGPADPALDGASRAELVEAANRQAAALGLTAGGRLLWTQPWRQPADWVAALLAPLAVGGSTVLVGNPDAGALDRRAAAERVTVRH
ncbi:MAG: TIGR03089 family protein [Jatrophihabitantaceae bacterium]